MPAPDDPPRQSPPGPAPRGRRPLCDDDQGLIRRGGLVDREALRRAVHSTGEPAGDESTVLSDQEGLEAPEALQPADDDAPNRVVFQLQRDLQKRLDKYLTDRIPFMSRNQLQRLIEAGEVKVNDRRPKASTVLRLGDRIEVFIPPPPATDIPPQEIPLDVLYEDEHIIVLNKRPDIIVHPARSHLSGTLLNALVFHFQKQGSAAGGLSKVGKEFARPGVVHRLDRHTSGVIVFAKQDEAHWKLAHQFEHRTVDKRYIAILHGRIQPLIDVIDLPLGPHPSREKGYREKYVVRHDHLGKPAVTIYRVLGHYPPVPPALPSPEEPGYSVVEVELKTGRTHQIRVHFSHLLHPLVGDDMYGGRPAPLPPPALGGPSPLSRQALHAATLSFRHPITGEPMSFTAPLPADMAQLIRHLRALPGAEEPPPLPGSTLTLEGLLARSD